MPKQKIEIGVDIPDGWEFVRVGLPEQGDHYVDRRGNPTRWTARGQDAYPRYIIRPAWKWPEWLTAEWIARDANGTWYAFADEPICLTAVWMPTTNYKYYELATAFLAFDPPPCTDWRESLRRNPHKEKSECDT